jgi:hypothetical protein
VFYTILEIIYIIHTFLNPFVKTNESDVGRALVALLLLSCHPYGARNLKDAYVTIMTSLRD